MDFVEYANSWARSEVTQGQIMIGFGVLLVVSIVGILKSEVELLRGTLLPLGLFVVLLIGYGAFILYSRPAHAKQSITLYQKSTSEAIEREIDKHVNDNKAGNMLMKIYPILAILALTGVMFIPSPYYKGMCLGFAVLFIGIYFIDNGFVTRSDAFLEFLDKLG